MVVFRTGSQFSHISQECHLSALPCGKYTKGSLHGHGICIVAVIDYLDAVMLYYIEPAGNPLKRFYSILYLLKGHSEYISHGSSRQSVKNHMLAGLWDADLYAFIL